MSEINTPKRWVRAIIGLFTVALTFSVILGVIGLSVWATVQFVLWCAK